jgi:hypothetical protein
VALVVATKAEPEVFADRDNLFLVPLLFSLPLDAISLILAPYLITIRKYSYEQAFASIKEWLNKCDTVKRVDSNFNPRIKYSLQIALKDGYRPLKLKTLKIKNEQLYNILFWP